MPKFWVKCTSAICVVADDENDAKIKFMEELPQCHPAELEFDFEVA